MRHLPILCLSFLAVVATQLSGQNSQIPRSSNPPIKEKEETERYDVPNLHKKVGTISVIPFFHPSKPFFWYSFENAEGRRTYYKYDLQKGKQELYDTLLIARFLEEKNIPQKSLFYTPQFTANGINASFSIRSKTFIYNADSSSVREVTPKPFASTSWGVSPDKKHQVKFESHNLFVKYLDSGETKQFSFDGQEDFDFETAELTWISSNSFYITRKDQRNVRSLAVLRQITTPPVPQTYKYELPGDSVVARRQLYLCNLAVDQQLKLVNTDKWKGQLLEIKPTKNVSDKVFFIRRKRTRDQLEVCYVDVATMNVKVVCLEQSKPYINEDMFSCQILNKGKDVLLWSDRTGWGHYYRYSTDGKLLNAVTKGEWTAGQICGVDSLRNNLYVYGYGREKGMNPNYAFLYKTDLSGKKIKLLTPENATHKVFVSPKTDLIIDNYSRIDTLPRTNVRDANGRLLTTLEQPDISRLLDYGWKMPEQFTLKAADGVTDLYGIMWKPFDFDPNKKYPVISQVYPGPQTETVWTDFTVFDRYNNTALAQRGFIVVCMGHRGGSPFRNAAYAKYGYGNLRDYALADDKAGLEQLGTKYSFIDLNRVGIVGHSGGGMMAAAAMCTYPDFYKVAVASSGNYDNTIYNRTWGETFQGIGEDNKFSVKTNQQLASGLKGHLLLVTGDVDQNVHPANTFRLVDALIQAGKDFDLLVLPGQDHHYEGVYKSYFEKKKRDYFNKYL
ncbi:MAG: hypothetical protein H6Q14_2055 [Bacteroidetes bacterium]|nr:hypothetical protein [Bacteroidota bacterium]